MKIMITPHPSWVDEFLDFIDPYYNSIVNGLLFSELAAGTLSIERIRGGLLNFYPLIKNFPEYMALTLAKVPVENNPPNNMARDWLIENISIERRHQTWFRQWAVDFGVPRKALSKPIVPPPEMDAVNNYLWRVAGHGSLVEGISAVNYAIEGPSGQWTKLVARKIRAYEKQPGVTLRNGTLTWINAHASYDDRHPDEALELIKAFAKTKQEQEMVKLAAQRSMEYYAMAADACYEMFG